VYSLSQMPRRFLWLWRFNPLTSIMQLLQHAFLGAPLPGVGMLTSNIVVILIVTVLGILTFRRESKTFDDWV
jgi:ABC-type polysaccharide/polyol phosphate export permease